MKSILATAISGLIIAGALAKPAPAEGRGDCFSRRIGIWPAADAGHVRLECKIMRGSLVFCRTRGKALWKSATEVLGRRKVMMFRGLRWRRLCHSLVVSFVAVLGNLIPATAQQANTTVLDNAALILALSASNPDRLVAMNFMANARADDQKIYRSVVAPCFRAFHDTYQGRLPALQQQLAVVENGMPHRDARGTSAFQAVLDAEGYIRAANIAELAITDPAHLANNADFRFNRNIHNQLIRILETWKRMPNSPAAAVSQQIEKQLEEGINSYKTVIKIVCKW